MFFRNVMYDLLNNLICEFLLKIYRLIRFYENFLTWRGGDITNAHVAYIDWYIFQLYIIIRWS